MRLTSGAARSVHPRPARRASLLALVALLLSTVVSLPSRALAQGAPFDPPDISCSGTSYSDAIVLNICGGGWGGAPAGFVVDFESQADFAASGWSSAASSYVSVQFTGDAYSLDAHECVNVQFGKNTFTGAGQTATNNSGAALACNTGYVFRAKALATSNMAESGWSGTLRCSTDYDCNIPAPGVGGATGGTPFDPPDIGCSTTTFSDAIVLNLCGGGWGGAPAGFIVEMQTQADLQTHGWSPTSPSYLGVTFTGDAYSLGAHQCVEIQFGKNTFTGPGEQATSNAGAPLSCNTEYAFRTRALATETMASSDWSGTLRCSTEYDCNVPAPGVGGGTGTTGNPFDPPDIVCGGTSYSDAIVLNLCGGGWGGAPAGFVVEMQSEADFNANGWSGSSPSFLSVQFTGDAYSLGAHECVNIQFGKNTFTGAGETASNNAGAPLACNTTYVFRTKALATSNMAESNWSGNLRCSTEYDCNIPAPGVGGGTTGNGNPFDPPDISCSGTGYSDAIVLNLCGGGWGGAPAGFVVELMSASDFTASGWSTSAPSYLSVTFTGDAYSLGAHQCVDIQFGKNTFTGAGESATNNSGAPLACNTGYVFRTKALATSNMAESNWSGTLHCSTEYDCNIPAPGVGGGTTGNGNPFDPPDISCGVTGYSDAIVLSLCGGGWGGAPAGFAVEMQSVADFNANGWSASSPSYFAVSFTGASYSLNAGQCINIQFGKNTFTGEGETASNYDGAPLACNTEYVFRTKAYATETMAESNWSGTLRCSTEYDCSIQAPTVNAKRAGCTKDEAYWASNANAWPVDSLKLGTVTYTKGQLVALLSAPAGRNGLVALAKQLVVAKLNAARGASTSSVAASIQRADALIGNLKVAPAGGAVLKIPATSALTRALASYNQGATGPGRCQD